MDIHRLRELYKLGHDIVTVGLLATKQLPKERQVFRLPEINPLLPGRASLVLFFIGSQEQETRLYEAIDAILQLEEVTPQIAVPRVEEKV